MVLNKIINRLILITGLVILFSFRLTGQGIAIDTSGYLPLFYDNALDYNLMIAASDGYSSEVERLIHKGISRLRLQKVPRLLLLQYQRIG
jgi:hypothetical protein